MQCEPRAGLRYEGGIGEKMNYRVFDPSKLERRQNYRFLVGAVVPRPIAWVSTISREGVTNLAPFSFFTCVCHSPPMLSISAGEQEGELKHTVKNILETRGYVIHTVVNGFEQQMNLTSANLSEDESEFDDAELGAVPADLVPALRIEGAPIAMECVFRNLITNGVGWRTNVVIGELVRWHIREDLLIEDDKYIDPVKLEPVGRLGGINYCRTHDIFQMQQPYPTPDRVETWKRKVGG